MSSRNNNTLSTSITQPAEINEKEPMLPPLSLTSFVKSARETQWILGFMRSTPDCALLVAPGGVILAVNEQSEAMFGYPSAQLVGQSVEILVPCRFAQTHPKQVESFFQHPTPVAIGLRHNLFGRHKDGRAISVEIGLTPITLEDTTLVLAMVRDISSRVQATEKLRLLLEAAPTAILMANREGLIEMVNVRAERLFGYDRAEFVGMSIQQLLPKRFHAKHPQYVASFFANPTPREMGSGREVFGLRSDGTEFPMELALGCVTIEDETYALATLVDISERKRLEKGLNGAREIQKSLLPRESPRLFGFDIAGVCDPACETGGDFFDYVKLPSGNLAVVVGDVCGHGFGPTLRAAMTQCSLRTLLRTGKNLIEAITGTNELLCEECPEAQFITLAALELIPHTGSFIFCGAGHEAYVFDHLGQIKHHLPSSGPPLGIHLAEFRLSNRIDLVPGELILIVTDGVYEAHSPAQELLGKQRIFEVIQTCQRGSARDVVDAVRLEISKFGEGLPQQDDVTIVAIKVRD